MRWVRRKKDLRVWHQWFAWYPVTIGEVTVWLERVWRRGKRVPYGHEGTPIWEFEYQLPSMSGPTG